MLTEWQTVYSRKRVIEHMRTCSARPRSACASVQSGQSFTVRSQNHWTLQNKSMESKCQDEALSMRITKTCLYYFDPPLKPHFYIVKLGFTGVYIIFLISAQNIDCGHSLESPRRFGSNEYPQSMFWAEIWKISIFFYLKIFIFWW